MKIIATGAVVLAAMICGQAWAGESSAISARSATKAVATKSEAREWLEKAEAVAEKIEEAKARNWALLMTACTCSDLFEVDRAKAIAAKLPEDKKNDILSLIPVSFARAGRMDEAVREAEAVNTPMAWSMVAGICSRKDVPRALQLLEKVPERNRAWAQGEIVKNQVLQGDLKGAESTIAKMKDEDSKEQAREWLLAGRFVRDLGAPDKGGAGAKIDPATIVHPLSDIACAKGEAGDLKKAEQILAVLKEPFWRSNVHIAIAEYDLKHDQKRGFQRAIDEAFKEATAIDNHGFEAIQRASAFLDIANLQVKAGQFDAAMKTIGLADQAGKEESKKWHDLGVKSGGIVNALGGKEALIGLLILADKVDEAVKVATQEDGTIMPKAVPLLVEACTAKGNETELAALMKLAKSPEVEYKLCLSAARGAAKKAGVISADESMK
jgi:hypothetical protein